MKRVTAALMLLLSSALATPTSDASALVFLGIRPGSWMASPGWCTMNFIFNATGNFEDGGPFYIGVAKHCLHAADPRGRSVVLRVAFGSDEVVDLEIGQVTYATKGAPTPDRDYALVRIKPELEGLISPSMAVVGGPTGVYTSDAFDEPAMFVGHGLGVGTGGTARVGMLTCACPSGGPYAWAGTFLVIGGDSGSGVQTVTHEAVGLIGYCLLCYYFDSRGELPPEGALFGGPRVTQVTDLWGLHVVTCASATPWAGFGCPPA